MVTPNIIPLPEKTFERHWQNPSCLQRLTSYQSSSTDSPNPIDNSNCRVKNHFLGFFFKCWKWSTFMHRSALKRKKKYHELLCYLSDVSFISLCILVLAVQDLLQNLLKCCKGGISGIVCSCLIYFHFKNQFGGLISHHLHRNPWRLVGCHLQAFIPVIALPWFIKMSLTLSNTIDSNDTLPRASHGTCMWWKDPAFCLRPLL